jgi:hypothetical protein
LLFDTGILQVAIYTTFFICKPQELGAGFPGWRPPLPMPVRREFKNPFTGEMITIESREPEWPDAENVDVMDREYQVVSIEGSYEDYLEKRIPQFVRAQPHWCARGFTEVELKPLCEAAGVEASFDCPLYGPPSFGGVLREIPPSLCARLMALDHKGLDAVAKRWAATMSTPEYTFSASGVKLSDGWTTDEALSVLQPIADLARNAIGGKRMYLLIEA